MAGAASWYFSDHTTYSYGQFWVPLESETFFSLGVTLGLRVEKSLIVENFFLKMIFLWGFERSSVCCPSTHNIFVNIFGTKLRWTWGPRIQLSSDKPTFLIGLVLRWDFFFQLPVKNGYSNTVLNNYMCQFGWAREWPHIWSNIICFCEGIIGCD